MVVRTARLALTIACLLPAFGIATGPVATRAGLAPGRTVAPRPASFIPACEPLPPRIEFFPSDAVLPAARPRGAHVDVYLAGRNPARPYTVLGEIQMRARNRRTGFRDLIHHAEREARRRGGDALIEVTPDPPLGRVIREPMRLNARIVTWG